MTRILFPVLFLFPVMISSQAQAGDWLEWQSNNVQALHGSGFELNDHETQTTLTFEHADGWKYGDNFFYMDYNVAQSEDINAEFSPRLSLSKMSGQDLSFGIVKDILISGTYEKARRFDAYLIGGAVDFDIPGFNLLQVNFYNRNNPDVEGHGWQTTVVWDVPFKVQNLDFSFLGYFDYADYEEGVKNFFTQPQLLLDVGALSGNPGHAYAGIEYRYWENKYGIDGVDESVPQAMVKWVF